MELEQQLREQPVGGREREQQELEPVEELEEQQLQLGLLQQLMISESDKR